MVSQFFWKLKFKIIVNIIKEHLTSTIIGQVILINVIISQFCWKDKVKIAAKIFKQYETTSIIIGQSNTNKSNTEPFCF